MKHPVLVATTGFVRPRGEQKAPGRAARRSTRQASEGSQKPRQTLLALRVAEERRTRATAGIRSGNTVVERAVVGLARPEATDQIPVPIPPAFTAGAIRARLDDSWPAFGDNEAREIVSEMETIHLEKLSLRAENHLMEQLNSGYVDGDDSAAIRALYATPTPDPAFDETQAPIARRILETILNDTEVLAAGPRWCSLSTEEKLEVLQRVAEISAGAYHIRAQQLQTFNEPPDQNGVLRRGDLRMGHVFINVNEAALGDFFKNVATTVHEVSHVYQDHLARRFATGNLHLTDPRYEAARAFYLGQSTRITLSGAPYLNQPRELHARKAGETVSDGLRMHFDQRLPTQQSRVAQLAALHERAARHAALGHVPREICCSDQEILGLS